MWMVSVAIIAAIQFGCSKKNGLSPDDTALIKGTDRGTFVGSGEDGSLADEGELSPLGTAITGLDGSDGLLPQDPFWDEPGRMDNPERPFEPIFFGFDQYNVGTAGARPNSRTPPVIYPPTPTPRFSLKVIATGRGLLRTTNHWATAGREASKVT